MKAIVLAAGKGTRLNSDAVNKPKVLTEVLGKSLIEYALEHIDFVPQEDICIVVGYKRDMVINSLKGEYKFAVQEEQLGTGHAVMAAQPCLQDYDGDVLILYGDMPLIERTTYQDMVAAHQKSGAACTFLTAYVDNPPAYGRIIRDKDGNVVDIVETKDCSEEQLKIREVNVGVYVFNSKVLFNALKGLNNNNKQKEYYLTDVPKILINEGFKVQTYTIDDVSQIYGVNTPEDLNLCREIILKRRKGQ
jgi:UDP-N-acetylglucosamine diphosphorylase/glucosamine-1-phosphate N-acetyltransferase